MAKDEKPTWLDRIKNLEIREGYAGKSQLGETSSIFGISRLPLKDPSRKNKRVRGTSKYGLYYDSRGVLTSGVGHKVLPSDNLLKLYSQTREEA